MLQANQAFSGFAVDDIEKAKHFYSNILGMEVTEESFGGLSLAIGNGGRIVIYPKADYVPATYTILNFPVDDLEATVDALRAAGVTFEQYDTEWIRTNEKGIAPGNGYGPDVAWFTDPAGNILAVMQE